jgi:hypothetical protein
MKTARLYNRFPWLSLHLPSLNVHVAMLRKKGHSLFNEIMFSAGCDEDVLGTNVLSKCFTCHQGPSNVAAFVDLILPTSYTL